MHQKPQCHECMGTDLNMKATATQVQILLKLILLLMHLFSPLPVLGSPTPSSIPAGNSAHSSEALSDFQCSSKNCLLHHSTQKSLRCCCFSSVCPSVTLSLRSAQRISYLAFFLPFSHDIQPPQCSSCVVGLRERQWV